LWPEMSELVLGEDGNAADDLPGQARAGLGPDVGLDVEASQIRDEYRGAGQHVRLEPPRRKLAADEQRPSQHQLGTERDDVKDVVGDADLSGTADGHRPVEQPAARVAQGSGRGE